MSQFRNLVFEGGGVKGIAYAGALGVLEAKGILPDIKRVAGTSAGAITATLVAAGCSAQDVQDIVGGTSFRSFMDSKFGLIGNVDDLIHDYGWYKGDTFAQWIQKILDAHAWSSERTFAELSQMAAKNPGKFRELTVIGSNVSAEIPQLFSAETTPDTPIWYAVRISMSIPLFFAAVKDQTRHAVFVDGGVTWNYPIDIFDEGKYVENPKAKGPLNHDAWDADNVYNAETLGFRLGTENEIQAEKGQVARPPQEIGGFVDFLKAMINFMVDNLNKTHIHNDDWQRTVFLDTLGVKATDFTLSDDTVKRLVQSGKDGATEYFKWFEDPKSQPKNRV